MLWWHSAFTLESIECNLLFLFGAFLKSYFTNVYVPFAEVSHAVYEVVILSDNVEETNEKFKVVLKSPQNAMLGENAKTVVQLIDYKNGKTFF